MRLVGVLRSLSMSLYSTDSSCWLTVSLAVSRSTLRHTRPAISARRMPVVAASRYSGYR